MQAFFERQGEGSAHSLHAALWAFLPPRALQQRACSRIKRRHILARDLICAIARQGESLAKIGAHKGNGAGFQIAFNDRIYKAEFQRLGRLHRLSGDNNFQRRFRADQAWQALRAARPRHKAALHFRQAQIRIGQRHARMAGKRHFKPTTKGRAMNGGDRQAREILKCFEDFIQRWRHTRLAEFGHLGAGAEHAARADDHHCLGAGGARGLHAIEKPGADFGAQRIHRGVGQAQHMHLPHRHMLHELILGQSVSPSSRRGLAPLSG